MNSAHTHAIGTIPEIVRNTKGVYKGNLIHYFQVVFNNANNLRNPYHNFRHMFHVLYLCYKACQYYGNRLSDNEKRALLIAALFHDFNHSGTTGPDSENIKEAIFALTRYILPEDKHLMSLALDYILATEFPYKDDGSALPLPAQILRDADRSQSMSVAWIQQIVFGLSQEWNKTPLEVLTIQKPFHTSFTFMTEWAKQEFPAEAIQEKIDEAEALIELLKEEEKKA